MILTSKLYFLEKILSLFFVSVSNDLPRTSYIKMVDVWLVFNLFIPFLEVLLHTYKVVKLDGETGGNWMQRKDANIFMCTRW